MPRLYVMALYATRPIPAAAFAAEAGDDHQVSLRVAMTVAADDEEARSKGLAQLTEWCPPVAGWVNHHVVLNIVPKDSLESFLKVVSDDPPDPDDDQTDWPDLIM